MATLRPLISCEQCGSLYFRAALRPGERAACQTCGTELWRHSGLTVSGWLALTLGALVVFIIANAYPVASMSVQGRVQQASLLDALAVTWEQGHLLVAAMSALAAFFLPLLQLLLLAWVLYPLSQGRQAPGFATALRVLGLLRPWCMVPVFLLGVIVAVVKLAGMASISPNAGLGGFAVLTVLLTILGQLSPKAVWRYAEDGRVVPIAEPPGGEGAILTACHTCGQVQGLPAARPEEEHACVRCDTRIHLRKPDHLTRTWALLIAAAIMYIPANVLPVMIIDSLTDTTRHTILGGVIELWQSGSWDLALIVFVASVVVPLTKLLSLALLAVAAGRGSVANLRQRTRLYTAVEFIGQWSMLDVFVVILLSALAHFQGLMAISAGPGAAPFGLVVVLTMLAAMTFDPRRGWDAARERGLEIAEHGNDAAGGHRPPAASRPVPDAPNAN